MNLLAYDEEVDIFPQIKAQGVNEALYKALYLLDKQKEVPSRDGTTKEVLNCRFIHTEPRDRFIRLSGRKHNVFSQIGETMWVLSGTNKLKYLSLFLKRAEQFSDDGGETWRSGYGKRLRNYPSFTREVEGYIPDGVDQFKKVIEKLGDSKETRRGFIVLTYPPVDHSPGIDVVCNIALHFIIRNDRLHMTIHNRSNDSVWGYSGINFFEFTVIQELICSILRNEYGYDELELGTFVHNSVSYHVYSRHYDRMKGILEQNGEIKSFDDKKHFPIEVSSFEDFDVTINTWLEQLGYLASVKKSDKKLSPEELIDSIELVLGGDVGNTLGIYASSSLLYVAQKHELIPSIDSAFSFWVDRYKESANYHFEKFELDHIKRKQLVENTYFFNAVKEKLYW